MRANRFITEDQFTDMLLRVSGGAACRVEKDHRKIGAGTLVKSSSRTGSIPVAASNPFAPLTIAITGQMISGKNRVRIRRDGHHYPEKQFINWRSKSYIEVLEQLPEHKTAMIETPVILKCWYWPSDRRTRDVTGMLDALFYLLVFTKVLKDDGLIHDCSWYRYPTTKFPKVVMEISEWS